MKRWAANSRRRVAWIAGGAFALSLHKYFVRDPLGQGGGVQGYIETILIVFSLAILWSGLRQTPRTWNGSLTLRWFMGTAILALLSSSRSFNIPLSVVEGMLFLSVLGIGYCAARADALKEVFQGIYWTYIASLIIGVGLAIAMPHQFGLVSVNDYDGRTRVSVFHTFPGTMGETAAYLCLLAPLMFKRRHRASRVLLLLANVAAGGKISSVALLCFMSFEILREFRSLDVRLRAAILAAAAALLCTVGLAASEVLSPQKSGTHPLTTIYGHDVAGEAASLDGRTGLWRNTVQVLLSDPALGYSGYGFAGARDRLLAADEWSGQSHNGFLEIALAGGLPALSLFIVGYLSVFRVMWTQGGPLRRLTAPVMLYMLIVACTGITFTFPSYFGILVLVLVNDQCSRPHPQAAWTIAPAQRVPQVYRVTI